MSEHAATDNVNVAAETELTQRIMASKVRAEQTAQSYDPRIKEFTVSIQHDQPSFRFVMWKRVLKASALLFQHWCTLVVKYSDGAIVTAGKLARFLTEVVHERGNKRKKDTDGTPLALGIASYESYVKAIISLYQQQSATKTNVHPHPRNDVIRTFLDNIRRGEDNRKRAARLDRGRGTINDGYTTQQMAMVCRKTCQTLITSINRIVS